MESGKQTGAGGDNQLEVTDQRESPTAGAIVAEPGATIHMLRFSKGVRILTDEIGAALIAIGMAMWPLTTETNETKMPISGTVILQS